MKKKIIAVLCCTAVLVTGCKGNGSGSTPVDGSSTGDFLVVDVGGAEQTTTGTISDSVATDATGSEDIPQEESVPENEDIPATEDVPVTSASTTTTSTTATTTITTAETTATTAEITATTAEATATTAETTATTAETTATTAETTATTAETTVTTATTTQTTTTATTTQTTSVSVELPQIQTGINLYNTLNYNEIRGVWISYLELSELLMGKSEEQFRANIGKAFDNCVDLGLNTVYVHARSHSDAYYYSELYPWSKYTSGTLGVSPGFDPLEIMIDEAHERELSVQAWINPLRGCAVSDIAKATDSPLYIWENSVGTGDYVQAVGSYYYLNPAYSDVIEYVAEGAAEIVANYDVDGLHIDDYFYPTTDISFDSTAYNNSGYSTVSEFRFANCDRLVRALYSAVKGANPDALFTVSVQGSLDNNYNQMYADVKKWCAEDGYLDVIIPQIYYGFDNSTEPYEDCVSEWDAIAQSGNKPFVTGLAVYKIGAEDTWAGEGKTEWITDEKILARQTTYAMEQPSYGGICLYSYRNIFTPDSGVSAQVNREISALKSALE